MYFNGVYLKAFLQHTQLLNNHLNNKKILHTITSLRRSVVAAWIIENKFILDITLADLRGTLAFLLSSVSPESPIYLQFNKKIKTRRRKRDYRMLWLMRFSGFISAAMIMVVLSPSRQSFPPAEAIRSSIIEDRITNLNAQITNSKVNTVNKFSFRRASHFRNAEECSSLKSGKLAVCDPSFVHVAITLDIEYLRGSIAAVHSILQHSMCPENIFFHFLVSESNLENLISSTFSQLNFKVYFFNPNLVRTLISSSVRQALEQPLNYARNYLSDLLPACVHRVIYLDSDLVLVDDVSKLWSTNLGKKTIGAPEYCHANFTNYFTKCFWLKNRYSRTFSGRKPCYFNTGVMVIDLKKWRKIGYTKRLERWMEIQKSERIYELGSLPPYLLVFAGHVAPIEHRWNQHGLGGDNVRGSCRDLHPGPVSLLHWSGSGKPWLRLDSKQACPLDMLWAPYDLFGQSR